MTLFGLVAFSLYALKDDERDLAPVLPMRAFILSLSAIGLMLSAIGICVLAAEMSGMVLFDLDHETLSIIMFETDIGTACVVRMAALATAFIAASLLKTRPVAMLSLACFASGLALATLVWTGHAGASEGLNGSIHRLSDIIHMLAAGVWIGGILAFAVLLSNATNLTLTQRALEQFAQVGTTTVMLIIATGLINSQLLIGLDRIDALISTSYGQLLTFKMVLFIALLGLAAVNRWRLTPALRTTSLIGNPAIALAKLQHRVMLEAGVMAVILGLVAWLGTLEPFSG